MVSGDGPEGVFLAGGGRDGAGGGLDGPGCGGEGLLAWVMTGRVVRGGPVVVTGGRTMDVTGRDGGVRARAVRRGTCGS